MIKIINTGTFSSLQDDGYIGYKKFGINTAGALDGYSYKWGNYLLRNKVNSVSIEITFGGFKAIFMRDTQIVITGAVVDIFINNNKKKCNQIINIRTNDILTMHYASSGIRIYLAVLGGVRAVKNFGSSSYNSHNNMGVLLKKNDNIKINNTKSINTIKFIPHKFIYNYDKPLILRILLHRNEFFTEADYIKIMTEKFVISNKNNRVAYKLEKCSIRANNKKFYSRANNYGSLQITQDGTPIIMLNDAPTIGGYPTIGTIFSLDLFRLAQYTTGAMIRFESINTATMQNLKRKFNNFFNKEKVV